MISNIIANVLVVALISLIGATVLYLVAKKFVVKEDERIDIIESILPGANCGACSKAGCRDFASCCVKCSEQDFANLHCPVGGNATMSKIADVLGYKSSQKSPLVAVLKCNGSCQNAPAKVEYIGLKSCATAHSFSVGLSGCPNGCLRMGDCVKVCKFGALHIDEVTGLPTVDEEKCTGCGACAKTCPRQLYELRNKGPKVYVACSNTQKGALAMKNCKSACIGCSKCAKVCPAIQISNNLSYIPQAVDVKEYGSQLIQACPTGAIIVKED